MLHIIFAHGSRLGVATQGSMLISTSGQVLDVFQLFAKSRWLLTASWPCVVKSFCPSPSKSPQRPHTSPCTRKTSLKMWTTFYWNSFCWHKEQTFLFFEHYWNIYIIYMCTTQKLFKVFTTAISFIIMKTVTAAYAVLWLQEDANSGFAIPHHNQTDVRFHHKIQAHIPYSVLNVSAMSQVILFIFTPGQFDFHSL